MDKGYYNLTATTNSNKLKSQSTIKMDKGYYFTYSSVCYFRNKLSQSTIKMDKGYYK